MVNQILVHIGNTPAALIEYCKAQNLQVESCSPIAHGQILTNNVITDMATKYGVTAAQMCIRYAIQLETVALPKAGSPVHMAENAAVDFAIAKEDMDVLRSLSFENTYGEYSVFSVFSGKQESPCLSENPTFRLLLREESDFSSGALSCCNKNHRRNQNTESVYDQRGILFL